MVSCSSLASTLMQNSSRSKIDLRAYSVLHYINKYFKTSNLEAWRVSDAPLSSSP